MDSMEEEEEEVMDTTTDQIATVEHPMVHLTREVTMVTMLSDTPACLA